MRPIARARVRPVRGTPPAAGRQRVRPVRGTRPAARAAPTSRPDRRSVYPWSFDRRALRVYRRYARAKVRLIPLVNRWSKRAARSGRIGPVRPLVLEDRSRPARSIDDQWLLGRRIMVAPVLREGARSRRVYLPRGSRWQQVTVDARGRLRPEGRPRRGGRRITASAPLADIPIFVRRPAAGRR